MKCPSKVMIIVILCAFLLGGVIGGIIGARSVASIFEEIMIDSDISTTLSHLAFHYEAATALEAGDPNRALEIHNTSIGHCLLTVDLLSSYYRGTIDVEDNCYYKLAEMRQASIGHDYSGPGETTEPCMVEVYLE